MAEFNIKRYMPKTLYGRAAAILLLPMLTIQLAVAAIFVQRHFEDVTQQMTNNLVREVDFVLDQIAKHPIDEVARGAASDLGFVLRRWDAMPFAGRRVFYDISGLTIVPTLTRGVPAVREVDISDLDFVTVGLETDQGPITLTFGRDRVSASNPHQVLVLMVFTGVFMTILAFMFLRNQLRPIKRLARASAAFGRGQHIEFRPTGAIEVRAAGRAFLEMRARLERQMEQRTLMLSGISHDLKTPLTRMQLALELSDDPEAGALKADVDDMAEMVDVFLAYSRDANTEDVVAVDLVDMLRKLEQRYAGGVTLTVDGPPKQITARPVSTRRAIENLLRNATAYADATQLLLCFRPTTVLIIIEDNGPGIPQDAREAVLRPFVRLDPARGQSKIKGTGLGMAIAADAIKAQGGRLELGRSATMGGLKVTITLPFSKDESKG